MSGPAFARPGRNRLDKIRCFLAQYAISIVQACGAGQRAENQQKMAEPLDFAMVGQFAQSIVQKRTADGKGHTILQVK